MTQGYIHSIESMGLVDGPGIRTVVFFQGCHLRCAYCHNPDTWNFSGGIKTTPREILKKLLRFKPYFERSGGGVTFSGGDPLVQPEFLLECLKLCKANNIHTTLDTGGYGEGKYDEILNYTDLVLLDIKQTNSEEYEKLTGKDTKGINNFLHALQKSKVKVWIRHVIVPNLTDSNEHIENLAKIIKSELPNVEKVELLPYHTAGVHKYKQLKIPYRFHEVPPMNKDKVKELQELINRLLDL